MAKKLSNIFKNLTKKMENDPMFKAPPLEMELREEIKKRKEQNSQIIWAHYYVPIAVRKVLKDSGNKFTSLDSKRIEYLASALMFNDMYEGRLNEFFKFENESEV